MIILEVCLLFLPSFPTRIYFSLSVQSTQYPSQHDQDLLLPGNANIYDAHPSSGSRHFAQHATPSPTSSAHSLQGGHDSDPASAKRSTSPQRYSSKRREKPRIELAPDQPLTTQGKPRTRVYVACVQWYVSVSSIFCPITLTRLRLSFVIPPSSRSRKIRCDGAKPVCHNCNRRASSAVGGVPECSYDAAPKRRGPDRNPGARQRASLANGTDNGGRKRRRRPTEQPMRGYDVGVDTQIGTHTGHRPEQKPMRTYEGAGIPPTAQSQMSTRPPELSVIVEDLDVYRTRDRKPSYTLDSAVSSYASPLPHFTPTSDIHQRVLHDSAPHLSQVDPVFIALSSQLDPPS